METPRPDISGVVAALRAASADKRLWRTKPGKAQAPYLPWQTVVGLLQRHAPDWTCSTTRIECRDGLAVVTVSLCVAGQSREASAAVSLSETARDGTEYAVAGVEIAERRALKRAASLFGVGCQAPA